ncbi:hematopoietic prostaglandin D synthase-like [Saccoglossus kowalevskii]|uniref:Hematopoietic prostaglandin D synthase-like n=1 Tax=Saccoglossus kowalevskii TaxID=10224 RepID=A0ABM0GJY2_SACKO|nr:PREDICTED: hematopoietic prostaglandin D synthase-like [Saccoglossus kowalevskii]
MKSCPSIASTTIERSEAMPSYKLYYFNARGRAEHSRLLFAMAGVEYQDVRYTREQWPVEKASGRFPFGQLPCLHVNGVMLAQSNAIARYLANEFGMAGKNNLEKAKVDMIVDAIDDLAQAMVKFFHEKDEQKKAEAKDEFKTKTVPILYGALERLLIANDGGDGFFVGEEPTLADFAFVTNGDYVKKFNPEVLDNYPKLKALQERVFELPRIAEWVKKRPVTEM